MSIIQKLWWFFKLEKRRYLVGIVALVLVSVLNLIPPMVMGRVIDAITSGQLTQQALLLDLFYLLLAAFGMYYLRYVGVCISSGLPTVWDRLCGLACLSISQKMSPAFYQTYRTGGSDGTRNQRYQCPNASGRGEGLCQRWMLLSRLW